MKREDAKKMIDAKIECIERQTSGTDGDCINNNCDGCRSNYSQGCMGEQKEALKMASKALQQQPCGDCISRQYLLDNCVVDKVTMPYVPISKIENAPPVTPQPKMGRWIEEKSLHGWDGKSYQCSECGRSIHLDLEVEDLNDYPYCHCGAKMQEIKNDN